MLSKSNCSAVMCDVCIVPTFGLDDVCNDIVLLLNGEGRIDVEDEVRGLSVLLYCCSNV